MMEADRIGKTPGRSRSTRVPETIEVYVTLHFDNLSDLWSYKFMLFNIYNCFLAVVGTEVSRF